MIRYHLSERIVPQRETERSIRLQGNCIAVDAVIPWFISHYAKRTVTGGLSAENMLCCKFRIVALT